MPVFLSTAAKAKLNQRFPVIFNGGRIDVFTGMQPESADHAIDGLKVATITAPGGLQFMLSGDMVYKNPTQVWTLQGVNTGIAGWFRLYSAVSDPGHMSSGFSRVDGLVWEISDPRTGLVLPSVDITPALNRPVEGFLFSV